MKVQSTGLGKTVMLAQFKELLNAEFDNRQVLQLTMESTEPLHWTIKVYMEPGDLRKAIILGLKPSILLKALLAVVAGRFSLFKKLGSEKKAPSTEGGEQTIESTDGSEDQESKDSEETVNPLAKLKG
jgi:hypothetical protein